MQKKKINDWQQRVNLLGAGPSVNDRIRYFKVAQHAQERIVFPVLIYFVGIILSYLLYLWSPVDSLFELMSALVCAFFCGFFFHSYVKLVSLEFEKRIRLRKLECLQEERRDRIVHKRGRK